MLGGLRPLGQDVLEDRPSRRVVAERQPCARATSNTVLMRLIESRAADSPPLRGRLAS